MSSPPRITRPAVLIAGILLISASLRAPITGFAPLLDMIRESFSLGTAEAGALTTLPLLAFAGISPFAVLLGREYGLERSLFGALLLIGGGIILRSAGNVWCLYLGTGIIGSGVAIGNVLLPSLLKRDFPNKIATLTSAYVLTANVVAATGSALVVPLAHIPGFGWPPALGAFLLLPLMAGAFWIPQLGGHTAPAKGTAAPPHGGRVWHSPLAWQVTLFLGLNSFVYYVAIGWLPAILAKAGYSPEEAGSLHGLLQLAVALPGLPLIPIVSRMKDQRVIAFGVSLVAMVGLVGLVLAPGWAALWVILFGGGTGAAVILALAFVSLRVTSSHQAAALSGMAQCIGYLLAAVGPTLAGVLHDAGGGWSLPLLICAVLCFAMGIFGLLAGRAIHIAEPAKRSR